MKLPQKLPRKQSTKQSMMQSMKLSLRWCITIAVAGIFTAPLSLAAEHYTFRLTLRQAENEALRASDQLKSYLSTTRSATEEADARFADLLPRITLDGQYSYITNVPDVALPFPGSAPFPFGSHNNYNIGPTLTYTLWDTGAARDAYLSAKLLADAREEDRKAEKLQLLLAVRQAYIQVQEGLEQLRLVNDSLNLARVQLRDISVNFRAGAASRMDRVDAERAVLSYQLQFRQSQAALSSSLEDLLALTGESVADASHPGPPGIEGATLELEFDRLDRAVAQASDRFSPPDETQPQLRSQELQARSNELAAKGEKAGLYPRITVSARAELEYPNVVILQNIEQNIFGVTLSMPLFEWNRTSHLAASQYQQAESTRFRQAQLRIDLNRDYRRAKDMLRSLRDQIRVAQEDVAKSEESARLYYASYRAGRINITDVLSANLRALQSKVNASQIEAQILNQIAVLEATTGDQAAIGGKG